MYCGVKSLAGTQSQPLLPGCRGRGHASAMTEERRNAADAAGWGQSDEQCYVVALELLDNLPHDRCSVCSRV